jgi:membrane fusion protein, type I secretion system
MEHLILDHSSASQRDTTRRAFRDLLLEAYQERELLLRSRIEPLLESPAPRDAVRPSAERPQLSLVEEMRRNGHLRAKDSAPRMRTIPPLRAPDTSAIRNEGARRRPDNVEHARREPDRIGIQTKLDSRDADGSFDIQPQKYNPIAWRPEITALAKNVISAATTKLPAIAARNVAEAFVPSRDREVNHDVALQRLWHRGLTFLAIFGGTLGLWSVATTMSSAVIGPGQFVVDGSVKKVQHPTGGVVSQLLVREGDQVSEGDLLIRLDETVTRANLQVIVGQLDELLGRRARLEAERDGTEAMSIPAELSGRSSDPEVTRIVASERKLFQARRSARESQRAQLNKRITQLQNEALGLQSQLGANSSETQIISEELKGVRELYTKQLVPLVRVNGLERQAVNLNGQKGQLTASIAQTEGKIAEIELQIMQIGEDLRAEAQKELREVQGKIAELSERRVAADDQLKRVELRAPNSGKVHQLAVHTIGGVISPAEPAMLIVPTKGELVVEARVMPQDRDQLQVGQNVMVRVHSSNQRNTPELKGTLSRIAADVSKDPNASNASPFYGVWVNVPSAELTRLRGLSIAAGMQAEVFIEAGSRSPLSYLLKPLTDQVSRAFKER